jgi:hypothetical protein
VVLFLSPGAIIVLFKNNASLLELVGFFKLSAKVEDPFYFISFKCVLEKKNNYLK